MPKNFNSKLFNVSLPPVAVFVYSNAKLREQMCMCVFVFALVFQFPVVVFLNAKLLGERKIPFHTLHILLLSVGNMNGSQETLTYNNNSFNNAENPV